MLSFLVLALGAATPSVVPSDIHAEAPSLLIATRGLVRETQPRLEYDMTALTQASAAPGPKLKYARLDELGVATDRKELDVAYQLAADIVRPEDSR